MELYHGSHGEHVLAYKKHIERVVNDAISELILPSNSGHAAK